MLKLDACIVWNADNTVLGSKRLPVCATVSGRVQQVVTVICHKAHRRRRRWFNVIRQVPATCPPMRAHWRHLANTIELVHPSAHWSPQPKGQMDRFSRFRTVYDTKCLYFTMGTPAILGEASASSPSNRIILF